MQIIKRNKTQNIKIKELFDNLEIPDTENENYFPKFNIQVNTPYGYKNINHLFRTEVQDTVTSYFGNNKTLTSSLHHLLYVNNEWKKIKDIVEDDVITTETGVTYLKSKTNKPKQSLYDLGVDDVHCYYSNEILSHNSWNLVNMAYHALKLGKKVIYYTMELQAKYLAKRFDTLLIKKSANLLGEYKDEISMKVKDLPGELIIKYYPTNTASILTLQSHIELCRYNDFTPDLIMVDYADLMKSSSFNSTRRDDKLLGDIYKELRGLAGELDIPIINVSQANRSAEDSNVIEGQTLSGSDEKLMIADFVASSSRKTKDKVNNTAKTHIIKNRFGPDGLTYKVDMDLSLGYIDIKETLFDEDEEEIEEKQYTKKVLNETYSQLKEKKDKSFKF